MRIYRHVCKHRIGEVRREGPWLNRTDSIVAHLNSWIERRRRFPAMELQLRQLPRGARRRAGICRADAILAGGQRRRRELAASQRFARPAPADRRDAATWRRRAEGGARASPIRAVALTNGDVDHVAGLLSLREAAAVRPLRFAARARHACAPIAFSTFLHPISWRRGSRCRSTRRLDVVGRGRRLGLAIEAFAVAGQDRALSRGRGRERISAATRRRHAGPARHRDSDGRLVLLHSRLRAARSARSRDRLRGAELVLFDGTLWQENEMIEQGLDGARPDRAWVTST